MQVQSFTEVGGHRVNEDAMAVQWHGSDPELCLCFVADGQGGRSGGGLAAQTACQVALTSALECSVERLKDGREWVRILRDADLEVAKTDGAGLTTLIALSVCRERVIGVSSGDSATWLRTDDAKVELTAGQWKNPPVGSGAAVPHLFAASLKGNWSLLAMTDGVWKYVGWHRIEIAASRLRGAELLSELQQIARLPSTGKFQDDFTIVLIEGSEPIPNI